MYIEDRSFFTNQLRVVSLLNGITSVYGNSIADVMINDFIIKAYI